MLFNLQNNLNVVWQTEAENLKSNEAMYVNNRNSRKPGSKGNFYSIKHFEIHSLLPQITHRAEIKVKAQKTIFGKKNFIKVKLYLNYGFKRALLYLGSKGDSVHNTRKQKSSCLQL